MIPIEQSQTQSECSRLKIWERSEYQAGSFLKYREQSFLEYDVQCWMNRYGRGEYIPTHRDTAGTTQLLIGLSSPQVDNGGKLLLSFGAAMTDLTLHAGDALLFRATEVSHETTPLVPTFANPHPVRVTAVARYFFAV